MLRRRPTLRATLDEIRTPCKYVGLNVSNGDIRIAHPDKTLVKLEPVTPEDTFAWGEGSDETARLHLAEAMLAHASGYKPASLFRYCPGFAAILEELEPGFVISRRAIRLWMRQSESHDDPIAGLTPRSAFKTRNDVIVLGLRQSGSRWGMRRVPRTEIAMEQVMAAAFGACEREGYAVDDCTLRRLGEAVTEWEAHANVGLEDGNEGVVGRSTDVADAVIEWLERLDARLSYLASLDACPYCHAPYPYTEEG